VDATETDELWPQVAARINSARGWSLRPLARLGLPRAVRRTWIAEAAGTEAAGSQAAGTDGPGAVVVKASANPFAASRAAWAASALSLLGDRGYPVPTLLWQGPLDGHWHLTVQERLPGQPLRTLDEPMLDALLALVEVQADQASRLGEGGWDLSWWTEVVLFDGWEGWWDSADAAAPATSRRLREFLEPARGHRLPSGDLVHGDLGLANVLAADGVITGIVDWDDLGVGCRATDLAGPLFEWHRLRLEGERRLAPEGHARLVGRIVEIAGQPGLRLVVAYLGVACLGLAAQRNELEALDTWRHTIDVLLDRLR
jgi:hypothetical protein